MHIKFIEILGNKVVFFDGHLRFFLYEWELHLHFINYILFIFFYIWAEQCIPMDETPGCAPELIQPMIPKQREYTALYDSN